MQFKHTRHNAYSDALAARTQTTPEKIQSRTIADVSQVACSCCPPAITQVLLSLPCEGRRSPVSTPVQYLLAWAERSCR